MLSDAWLGDSAGIFALGRVVNWQESADDAPADPVDANYVINCNDSAPGPNAEQPRAEVRRLLREAPLFGPHTAGALLSCVSWQPRRTPLADPVAAVANPLLVIGTVNDAATPYVGAVALTRVLGNARLLTWEGNNHTALAFSNCVAEHVARYLIEVVLPPDGARCPA